MDPLGSAGDSLFAGGGNRIAASFTEVSEHLVGFRFRGLGFSVFGFRVSGVRVGLRFEVQGFLPRL